MLSSTPAGEPQNGYPPVPYGNSFVPDNAVFTRRPIPYRQAGPFSVLHRGGRRICLDESGTQVWQLIDGARTVNDIALEAIRQGDPNEPLSEVRPGIGRF